MVVFKNFGSVNTDVIQGQCYCIQCHVQTLHFRADLNQKDFEVNNPVYCQLDANHYDTPMAIRNLKLEEIVKRIRLSNSEMTSESIQIDAIMPKTPNVCVNINQETSQVAVQLNNCHLCCCCYLFLIIGFALLALLLYYARFSWPNSGRNAIDFTCHFFLLFSVFTSFQPIK